MFLLEYFSQSLFHEMASHSRCISVISFRVTLADKAAFSHFSFTPPYHLYFSSSRISLAFLQPQSGRLAFLRHHHHRDRQKGRGSADAAKAVHVTSPGSCQPAWPAGTKGCRARGCLQGYQGSRSAHRIAKASFGAHWLPEVFRLPQCPPLTATRLRLHTARGWEAADSWGLARLPAARPGWFHWLSSPANAQENWSRFRHFRIRRNTASSIRHFQILHFPSSSAPE
jgi:hypothetical protein